MSLEAGFGDCAAGREGDDADYEGVEACVGCFDGGGGDACRSEDLGGAVRGW